MNVDRASFRPERAKGNIQTDKQKKPCVLSYFVPFGAAAQRQETEQFKTSTPEKQRCVHMLLNLLMTSLLKLTGSESI